MTLSLKAWILIAAYAILLGIGIFLILSQGAPYRFSLPPEPPGWDLPCQDQNNEQHLSEPFIQCRGSSLKASNPNIFLLGDSHAVQLSFPIREVAEGSGMTLFYPNRPPTDYDSYPYSFWKGKVSSDLLIDYVITHSKPGDFFITSIHRGRFNPSRDKHIPLDLQYTDPSTKAENFQSNMMRFLPKLDKAGLNVLLVKDGPLLEDSMTSISECMYQFTEKLRSTCDVDLEQDLHTRAQMDQVFDDLDAAHTFVQAVDIAPELYRDGIFTAISEDGKYRMRDKHHLSEEGALELTPFFERLLTDQTPTNSNRP